MIEELEQLRVQTQNDILNSEFRVTSKLMSNEIKPIKDRVTLSEAKLHTFDDRFVTVDTKADKMEVSILNTRVDKLEQSSIYLSNNSANPFSFIQISSRAIRVTLPFSETSVRALSKGTLSIDDLQGTPNEKMAILNACHTTVDTFLYAELAQRKAQSHDEYFSNGILPMYLICVMQNNPKTFELIEEIKFEKMLEEGKVDK